MDDHSELRSHLHDLNNALTRILTSAEFLDSESETPEQLVADAKAIREAALDGRRIAQRIRDLLVVGTS